MLGRVNAAPGVRVLRDDQPPALVEAALDAALEAVEDNDLNAVAVILKNAKRLLCGSAGVEGNHGS